MKFPQCGLLESSLPVSSRSELGCLPSDEDDCDKWFLCIWGQSPALAEAGEEVDCKDSTLRHLNKGQTQRTLWIEVFVAGEEAKQKQTESLDLKPILCLLAFIPS